MHCDVLLWYRLDDEQKENQRRRDEIAELTCRLTQKEHEAFELTKYVACLKSQLALMAPKLEKYEREVEVYSQQWVLYITFVVTVIRVSQKQTTAIDSGVVWVKKVGKSVSEC